MAITLPAGNDSSPGSRAAQARAAVVKQPSEWSRTLAALQVAVDKKRKWKDRPSAPPIERDLLGSLRATQGKLNKRVVLTNLRRLGADSHCAKPNAQQSLSPNRRAATLPSRRLKASVVAAAKASPAIQKVINRLRKGKWVGRSTVELERNPTHPLPTRKPVDSDSNTRDAKLDEIQQELLETKEKLRTVVAERLDLDEKEVKEDRR